MMIYLDNAATTRTAPEAGELMVHLQKSHIGNASALHVPGIEAATYIERARIIIAGKINADPDGIVFTSGGTESNNFALKGTAFANAEKRNHIIISAIEHPSVLACAQWLGTRGFKIDCIPVDSRGFVNPEDIEKTIRKETILVSVMHANNEIGTIEPIAEIGAVCRRNGIYFHVDACQSFTRAELDVVKQNIDLLSISGHKIHGPRGIGAVYIRKGVKVSPLLHGGGQENGLRSGTYNTEAVAGFAKAVEISKPDAVRRMSALRDYFIGEIQGRINDVILNGPSEKRICNNISLTFKKADAQSIFRKLNKKGIFISTGAACTSGKTSSSHVLAALGNKDAEIYGAIRVSLSKWTTKKEIDITIETLSEIVSNERQRTADAGI
ncbi:MAG: cysteine desulfurase family protein [bacterium]